MSVRKRERQERALDRLEARLGDKANIVVDGQRELTFSQNMELNALRKALGR